MNTKEYGDADMVIITSDVFQLRAGNKKCTGRYAVPKPFPMGLLTRVDGGIGECVTDGKSIAKRRCLQYNMTGRKRFRNAEFDVDIAIEVGVKAAVM